jgi:tetratricopeptide (TPR) repeat protein
LAQDPFNLYARHGILDYLEYLEDSEDYWYGNPEDIENAKEEVCDLIRHLIRLARVEDIPDWRTVAWEIVTAVWASDHDRALRLFDHALAAKLAPRGDLQLLRARHLFFTVYLSSICNLLASEFNGACSMRSYPSRLSWQPFLGLIRPWQRNLFIGTIALCEDVRKLRTNLTDEEKAHLRYALADVESADTNLEGERQVFQFILPACLYSVGRYHEAADAYKHLLSKCASDPNEARIPLLRSIALCHDSAGDLQAADAVLEQLQEAFPNEKGVRLKRADLFHREANFERAYQMLREEADLDPNVSEQPYASLALSLGEIAHDQSAANLSSAIARGFLERNPAVGSMIDALHDEY